MRVLMLTPWYPDDRSPNSGIFIQSQAQALSEIHEVVVVSAKVDYTKFGIFSFQLSTTRKGLVEEHRLMIRKSLPIYNQLNHLLITCLVTWRLTRKWKPEMIHASIGFPGAFWGWAMSKLLGVPFVFTEHTRITNNFRSAFHKVCTLRPLAKASKVMAVSSSLAKEMQPWLKSEVMIMPNIIDVHRFAHIEPAQNEIPQIGLLGGFNTPVKGLDILLKALSEIEGDFVLHIGGAGSLEDSYKLLAEELGIASKCRFYGFIPYDQVPKFMARLHFYVCSSRYETFCVSLVEAMASGRPVVSTRCGGPEDFVNEDNGILCDKESQESLQQAIDWMILNYKLFNPVKMRAYIGDNFTAKSFLKQINEVYSKTLSVL